MQVYGDGEQIMDMSYVRDVADVLVRALLVDHHSYDCVFEAGTGRRITVNEIASLINACAGNAAGCSHVPMRAGEPSRAVVVGDPTTLKPLGLDADRLVKLEDGLERTVSWCRENYAWQADPAEPAARATGANQDQRAPAS